MRPDPNDHSRATEPARIIYLGEVRRRRSSRRSASDRHYLAAIGLATPVGWGVWLSVVFTLQPAHLLTYLAFFVPLFVALACTVTLGLYILEWRRGLLPRVMRCGLRGGVVASVLILNLAFQAAHAWTIIVLGATVLLAAGAEAVLERRTAARS